jgi:hypothetical protein
MTAPGITGSELAKIACGTKSKQPKLIEDKKVLSILENGCIVKLLVQPAKNV